MSRSEPFRWSVIALTALATALTLVHASCAPEGSCVRNSDCTTGMCVLGGCSTPVVTNDASDGQTVDAGIDMPRLDASADAAEDAGDATIEPSDAAPDGDATLDASDASADAASDASDASSDAANEAGDASVDASVDSSVDASDAALD
jgi:hypothetical protein